MEDKTVTLSLSKYEEMVNKIARFNVLINCIRQEIDADNKYPVDNGFVLSICGLKSYKAKKESDQKAEA